MPNYTYSEWHLEPWRHRHARATAFVDVMHILPNGDSVGWCVYDSEQSSSRPRRHPEPTITPAIQPRQSRRSSDYYRPSRRRSSERQEPRFLDQFGYEIGFQHGLINMLDEFFDNQDPSLFILGFLAILDSSEGASGSVSSRLLQPFSYSRNIPTRISDKYKFDRCVSRLEKQGFVDITNTRGTTQLAFRHRLTAKGIRNVIVNWLFETGLGLPFFRETIERLTAALLDKKVHHMERLVEVYQSHIFRRRSAPGDSELQFADLLLGAAWNATLEQKKPKIAEYLLMEVDIIICEMDNHHVWSRGALLQGLKDRRDTLSCALHSEGGRGRQEEYGRSRSSSIMDWAGAVSDESDCEIHTSDYDY